MEIVKAFKVLALSILASLYSQSKVFTTLWNSEQKTTSFGKTDFKTEKQPRRKRLKRDGCYSFTYDWSCCHRFASLSVSGRSISMFPHLICISNILHIWFNNAYESIQDLFALCRWRCVYTIYTYKMENRMTIFLESNEAARLYLLHLFVGASWHLSETALSATKVFI